jgi:predicted DNA-binding protein (MmcQ/YjbR family)
MSHRGKPSGKAKRQIQALRKHALSFPETREDHPWGESAFKVKGKVFLFVSADAEGWGMGVKLEESHTAALAKPFASPTRYGLGKHGWVSSRFGPKDDAPMDLLKRWVAESFTIIAPLKVLEELEGKEAAGSRKKRR